MKTIAPCISFGPDFKLDPKPEYETERQYLERLDLLTDYERNLNATQLQEAQS